MDRWKLFNDIHSVHEFETLQTKIHHGREIFFFGIFNP